MSPRRKPERPGEEPERFSDAQRARMGARQADQDRTLEAMHALEAALAAAAPGRLEDWQDAVSSALAVLDDATAEEAANAERPDSLLSDIAHTQPRLRNRVRGVRLQYRQLREVLHSLRAEVSGQRAAAVDFADLRQRLAWALTSLRYQRARESDLIYEAYFDAFRADLREEGAGGGERAT
ncbi:MAG TPA: hypothetical protein VME46_13525 [Acidimicrobiales bacterium]|nr:hypothetical protein [Acidimicrobiales bacterium]